MPLRFFAHRPEVLEAFVVFERQQGPHWWTWCSPAEFGHCWVFWCRYYPEPGLLAQRFTTKIEQAAGHLHADTWLAPPEDIAQLLLDQGVTDVLYLERVVKGDGNPVRGMQTCVSVTKAALCIGAPWVLTPWQLHAYLRRQGAASLGKG